MTAFAGRHAGLLVPLFSMPSRRSWGIGEIPDLPVMGRWLADAGLDFLQVLPVNEMARGQSSPYSAITAMAIDPIFVHVPDVEDFVRLGGESAASPDFRRRLDAARHSPKIDYHTVRSLKSEALRAAFEQFFESQWVPGSLRSAALRQYIRDEGWWLPDYALFRALHARLEDRPWTLWKPALRNLQPRALAEARRRYEREILFYEYLQWQASLQWDAARATMDGVGLFGDFPFMVSLDSADVWTRQKQFMLDASVGVPPDAFSETGQDWGLPAYRWDVMMTDGYEWLRWRARRSAELYDGYRLDHLVGFYRTYVRPRAEPPRSRARPAAPAAGYFTPADQDEQLALGERLLDIFTSAGPRIIAEDLGTVPDFVRASLARLGVPGFKVLRWEREWDVPNQPFRNPAAYPSVSVATSGTHDTDPMAAWWAAAPEKERVQVLALPSLRSLRVDPASPDYPPELRDGLIEVLFAAGSDFVLFPIQDVFGWDDRINVPATVADENWTYRLPWPVDDLSHEAVASERAARLRQWSERYARGRSQAGRQAS